MCWSAKSPVWLNPSFGLVLHILVWKLFGLFRSLKSWSFARFIVDFNVPSWTTVFVFFFFQALFVFVVIGSAVFQIIQSVWMGGPWTLRIEAFQHPHLYVAALAKFTYKKSIFCWNWFWSIYFSLVNSCILNRKCIWTSFFTIFTI
jgi:hypothetical protein